MQEVATCFEPVYDKYSKVLFLGTIPSLGSVSHGFYYLGAGNKFWELLSSVTCTDFVSLKNSLKTCYASDNVDKYISQLKKAVLDNKIALYDTIESGIRHGSRDDQIDKAFLQSKEGILEIINNSSVKKIFCTSAQALNNLYKIFGGKTTAESVLRGVMGISEGEVPCEKLLSPSATAIMYGQVTEKARLEDWQKVKKYL